MDKKDFILKNYSSWVLFVCGLWLIGYWAGALIQKAIPNWFLNPFDNSPLERLIISIPPIFGLFIEWHRQSRIWNRLPWNEGDLVKPRKCMDNRFMVVLSNYIPKGRFTGTIRLLDGENVFSDTGKGNYRLFFKDSMNYALEKGFVKPNVPRDENGVIIVYQYMLKFLSKVFGTDKK